MLTLIGLIYLTNGKVVSYQDGFAGPDDKDITDMIQRFRDQADKVAADADAGLRRVAVDRLDFSLIWG